MAKHLASSSPDVPDDFRDSINQEADRQVEAYTAVALEILAQVPIRVAERIKSFQPDWTQVSLALSGPSNSGSSGQ